MGGFVVVKGKRQPVKIDPKTLQKLAGILGIKASGEVTAIAVAVSSKPSSTAKAPARSRRKGRARRANRSGRRRPRRR